MANRLAGQKAKFTRAFSDFQRTEDGPARANALRLMAEVLRDAPGLGFTVEEVTQGADIPAAARDLALGLGPAVLVPDDDAPGLAVQDRVDISDCLVEGAGPEWLYAYGYPCAPGRLKIGRATGDPVTRVVQQITTSTPDRPAIVLTVRTPNATALERLVHAALDLDGRRLDGGGTEWFRTSRAEVLDILRRNGALAGPSDAIRADGPGTSA